MSKVTKDEINHFFLDFFTGEDKELATVHHVADGEATLIYVPLNTDMRPGGIVSGPTQMRMADQAAYAAIFTQTGITPMALTSNINIDFLRPLYGSPVYATASITHFGSSRIILDAKIYAEGKEDKPTSVAKVTYVLPRTE